jgi:16S rRNA (cytosine967-C5)-methyltransferase
MSQVSPARRAAFHILLAVERGSAHSDDLLRGREVNALTQSDRNLATALVLGVLRWQIRLDHQIGALLKRPGAKLDPEVRITLRLGAFQLLFLDRIPAHAAIDESVELVLRAGHRFASGMVNAVLRKLSVAPRQDFREHSVKEVALAEAHPLWMVERWVDFYGMEAAQAICRHGQNQPALALRLESPAVEAELTGCGIELAPGDLLSAARKLVSGDATTTAAFREGRVRIQDEGSQLIGELTACSGADLDQRVKSIVDTCAAPGGKTLILAERYPEARIVACESSFERLEALRERIAAHAGRVEFRHADATSLGEEAAFDLALADVPCSGTGTLGRNPEIRHRLRPEDLSVQAERQKAILRAALRAVRPGGRVVYSTCSLEPEENERVVAATLAENPKARLVSLRTSIDALAERKILTDDGTERLRACLTPEGALRLLPGEVATDGFYVAALQRFDQ